MLKSKTTKMFHKMSHNMTNPTKWVCTQWRLRSAWASAQSDQSSLCTQWVAKDPSFLHADSEDSDQTEWMPRLIWVFAGRKVILLVLSCRGSNGRDDILDNVSMTKQAKHVWPSYKFELRHEKTCLYHMKTTKAQISLHICAVWSAPLLFTAWIA